MIKPPEDKEKDVSSHMGQVRSDFEGKSGKAFDYPETAKAGHAERFQRKDAKASSGSRPPEPPKDSPSKPEPTTEKEETKEPTKLQKGVKAAGKAIADNFSKLSQAQAEQGADIIRNMGPKGKGKSKDGKRRVGG
jgi:hypothetical protein